MDWDRRARAFIICLREWSDIGPWVWDGANWDAILPCIDDEAMGIMGGGCRCWRSAPNKFFGPEYRGILDWCIVYNPYGDFCCVLDVAGIVAIAGIGVAGEFVVIVLAATIGTAVRVVNGL